MVMTVAAMAGFTGYIVGQANAGFTCEFVK